MADPATITLAIRAAVSDRRTWKVIGVVIAAVLTPLILVIVMMLSLLSATADHNNSVIDLCFNGGGISSKMPENYAVYIKEMRKSFSEIDTTVADISAQIVVGKLDNTRIKAVFFSLFFGAENPDMDSPDCRAFVECFVRYEEQTRTVKDKKGKETSTVAEPVESLPEIYHNLEKLLGRTITNEKKANASEIYHHILYGGSIPTEGSGFDEWMDSITPDGTVLSVVGENVFCSPLGDDWHSMVTSEFGWRIDPITGKGAGHTGIDLGVAKGTAIRAAMSGTVLFVRYKSTGYGYHLAINHGDGVVTLYAHCSRILVTEGQTVSQGDIIAEVGSTGRSTGNHLHFEVRINGEKQNPRNYLP